MVACVVAKVQFDVDMGATILYSYSESRTDGEGTGDLLDATMKCKHAKGTFSKGCSLCPVHCYSPKVTAGRVDDLIKLLGRSSRFEGFERTSKP